MIGWRRALLAAGFISAATFWESKASITPEETRFNQSIKPLLEKYCFDCHGDGMDKGNVAFDSFKNFQEVLDNKQLWVRALKNVRAGLMPPLKKPHPTAEEFAKVEKWVMGDVFNIDPADPDPGKVTVRRLNRVEYRNTIRDLMGIDFNTEVEFPADDTGHGFDNIGDVLTLSPMLIEKYLDAAKAIVEEAVPKASRVAPEKRIPGNRFSKTGSTERERGRRDGPLVLSYYEKDSANHTFKVEHTGKYNLLLNLTAAEKFVDNQFDLNKCRFVFKVDDEELVRREFSRESGRPFRFQFDRELSAGEHNLFVEVEPLTPGEKQVRDLNLRIDAVTVRGPDDQKTWHRPKNFDRFFAKDAPESPEARRGYAGELLTRFATKAFRRPVDKPTVRRLVDLAESVYRQEGQTFEAGVAQAMVAVLASPRFLFREEFADASSTNRFPYVDEYSLASRLSYFLWSSMPDAELFKLAEEGKLRENIDQQLKRMLADGKSGAFIRNFVGQWLQARDIESVPIDHRAVITRETEPDREGDQARKRFMALREIEPEKLTPEQKEEMAKMREKFQQRFRRFGKYELNGEIRRAMRQETEKYFEYVLREDRSLLELLDSDYTFLNKRLAEFYGINGVDSDDFEKFVLPKDDPRGGILTQGTVLAVTSNPTRTSPVKRGLFLLENILGTPTAPPPPDLPSLEDSAKSVDGREPTLRETLAIHREKPMCSSCHDRMDPLGLALENFNALGLWREKEKGQPVDPTGTLITGEAFSNIQELKRILATKRKEDFYRCFAEKLLTYALGRGLEYYDTFTVDALVERLDKENGRPSAILKGIVESAPFQKTRRDLALREKTPGAETAIKEIKTDKNYESTRTITSR